MQTKYRINGDVLHLFTHGSLIPKKSIHVVVYIPQKDGTSTIKISVESLTPIEIQMNPQEAAEFLLALENWLASSFSISSTSSNPKISANNLLDELDSTELQSNKEEMDLFLQGSQSFEDAINIFNRKQNITSQEETEKNSSSTFKKESDDNRKNINPEIFDLSD